MKRENADQKGQKDNFPSQPHTHTHAWGTNQDTDLEWIPDNEIFFEGSETLVPLPLFCDHEYNWPMMLKQIIEKGRTIRQKDILLLGAINVIGATLGPKVRTIYGGKWLSPSMMLFVVAPPASGKGILSYLRLIAKPWHDALIHRYETEMKQYQLERIRFDSMGKARATVKQEEIPQPPVRRFFLISGNNSGTGMQANLINSGGHGLIFETEADTLSTALQADYGHFDDALRNAFDHERISYYRRAGDESREIQQSYLSVLLSGTPGQVKPLIRTVENGLASRFIWYYMPAVEVWQSQFDCNEDLSAWFTTLGRQWKQQVDTLHDISHLTLELNSEQKSYLNIYMELLFKRGIQNIGQESLSSVIRIAPHLLRIMSVVALLRHMEEGTLLSTPAPDIHPENIQDHICPRYVYGISMQDFTHCLMLGHILFSHAMHILSLLPAVELKHRGSADKEQLFSSMKNPFDRKSFLDKAGEMGFAETTALSWLKSALRKNQIVKIDRGVYQFVTHEETEI